MSVGGTVIFIQTLMSLKNKSGHNIFYRWEVVNLSNLISRGHLTVFTFVVKVKTKQLMAIKSYIYISRRTAELFDLAAVRHFAENSNVLPENKCVNYACDKKERQH